MYFGDLPQMTLIISHGDSHVHNLSLKLRLSQGESKTGEKGAGHNLYKNDTATVVVQLLSHAQLFVTPWNATHQAPLSSTVPQILIKFTSIESMMLSNHLTLCCPLLLLPSFFPSTSVFSNESALPIRWPKYWSFSINSSNDYSGSISFRIERFDLLAVEGTCWQKLVKTN